LDELLERPPLPSRDGFCSAEEWPRNLECRFHKAAVSPIFMGESIMADHGMENLLPLVVFVSFRFCRPLLSVKSAACPPQPRA
jgi:hypothetical protein